MYKAINFISFFILMMVSIRTGDPVAILISVIGFTIMHVMCEEMDNNNKHSNYHVQHNEKQF